MQDFLSLMGDEIQPSDVKKLKYILKDNLTGKLKWDYKFQFSILTAHLKMRQGNTV